MGSGSNLGTSGLDNVSNDVSTSSSPLSGGQISGLTPARGGGGAAIVGRSGVSATVPYSVHPMADGDVSFSGDSGSKGISAGVQKLDTCTDGQNWATGPRVRNGGGILVEGVE